MIMPSGTARMVMPSGFKRDQHQLWANRQDGYAFGLEMEWTPVMGWWLCLRARWVCLLARRACLWVLWNGHRSGWHNGYACGPLNGTNISNWIWVQLVCLLVKKQLVHTDILQKRCYISLRLFCKSSAKECSEELMLSLTPLTCTASSILKIPKHLNWHKSMQTLLALSGES